MQKKIERIVFISQIVPDEIANEYISKKKKSMQEAAISFQRKIIDGLESNLGHSIDLVNLLPVSSYPKYYADAYIPAFSFSHSKGAKDTEIGFLNISCIKQVTMPYEIQLAGKKIKWETYDCVICYTADHNCLRLVELAKKNNPQIGTCLIVPDMPDYIDLSNNLSIFRRLYKRWTTKKIKSQLNVVDKFVFLTDASSVFFAPGKPYTVVEGICDVKDIEQNVSDTSKYIFYSGTTNEAFGIRNLVDAFRAIDDLDIELRIAGCGDSDEYIRDASQFDKRIRFMGLLSHDEVLLLQKNATVLVNPRQNIGEFTKYSFPSKTMEYLVSGVPLVAYKLDGIPDEYDPFIFYVPDNTIGALTETLKRVMSMPLSDRYKFGKNAREYVCKQKNGVCQTQKILDLLLQ